MNWILLKSQIWKQEKSTIYDLRLIYISFVHNFSELNDGTWIDGLATHCITEALPEYAYLLLQSGPKVHKDSRDDWQCRVMLTTIEYMIKDDKMI